MPVVASVQLSRFCFPVGHHLRQLLNLIVQVSELLFQPGNLVTDALSIAPRVVALL